MIPDIERKPESYVTANRLHRHQEAMFIDQSKQEQPMDAAPTR